MKFLPILSCLLATALSCSSSLQKKREFEGTITYQVELISKTPRISSEALQKMYGNQMVLSIKGNNYRMSYKGLDLKDIFYVGNENKQYALRQGIDTLFSTDCSQESRPLISSNLTTEGLKILGRNCSSLILDLGETKSQYWFSPTLYIAPTTFKAHKFGYTNVFYEKAQSPILKYKFEGKSFTLIQTAVSVDEHPISQNQFQPPSLPKKSSF
jgi:hypothetical protein